MPESEDIDTDANGVHAVETTESERLSIYQSYVDLNKLKWSNEKIAGMMSITTDTLEDILKEFGSNENED